MDRNSYGAVHRRVRRRQPYEILVCAMRVPEYTCSQRLHWAHRHNADRTDDPGNWFVLCARHHVEYDTIGRHLGYVSWSSQQ